MGYVRSRRFGVKRSREKSLVVVGAIDPQGSDDRIVMGDPGIGVKTKREIYRNTQSLGSPVDFWSGGSTHQVIHPLATGLVIVIIVVGLIQFPNQGIGNTCILKVVAGCFLVAGSVSGKSVSLDVPHSSPKPYCVGSDL